MDLTTTDLYWVAKHFFFFVSNPFISLVYSDPTVPVTQCNGLCHVTLSHNYPLGAKHQFSRTARKNKKLRAPNTHHPTTDSGF